ncbi:MAG TPA: glycine acetyltransferase, partial [Clostridiales bacterium]|nr:glycine acetyltransferase [Clostridiales bacterium]
GKDDHGYALSSLLRKAGVFVPPAVYPAVPKNQARLRFCVISEHKPEQIIKALDTLMEISRTTGMKLPGRTGE